MLCCDFLEFCLANTTFETPAVYLHNVGNWLWNRLYICSPDLGYRLTAYREAFMNVSPHPFFFPHRNNLTVVDAIMVEGQGTTESLKVAGKPPGPGSSLRFKITEALLKDCSESEYFLSLFAEQKRNHILCVKLEMCGSIFPLF